MRHRPTTTADLQRIGESPRTKDDLEAFCSLRGTRPEELEAYLEEFCRTVVRQDGYPLAIVGSLLLWKGRCLSWMVFSSEADSSSLLLVRGIEEAMSTIIKKHEIWRVEASVDCKNEKGIKLVEHLGFKRECLMRCYGTNREDHFLYSYIED